MLTPLLSLLLVVSAQNVPDTELASWVGAEKQTVAEAIGTLARDGVIVRKHKNLHITDRARLQRLATQ